MGPSGLDPYDVNMKLTSRGELALKAMLELARADAGGGAGLSGA